MADKLEVDLTLNDRVSAAAKAAADALGKVESAAGKAQDKLSGKQMDAFGKAFAKVGVAQESANIKSAKRHEKAFSDSWAKIGLAAAKQQAQMVKGAHEVHMKLTDALSFGAIAGVGFEAVHGIAEVFKHGAEIAVEILKEGIKMSFEAGSKSETQRLAYRLTLGKENGKEYLEDIERFSKKSKYTGGELADMAMPLLRAGLRGKEFRSAVAMSADIEAGGGMKTGEMIQAITHIMLKGGVTERMLPNMGVDAKAFYKDLSKQLGVSAEAAKKMATEGKIDPIRLIHTLEAQTQKRQGMQLGGGSELAANTMEARLHKLKALPEEYLRKLSESPQWDTLTQRMGDILKGLDPDSDQGKQIMSNLFGIFDKIASGVSKAITPESINAFATGVERALHAADMLVSAIEKIGGGIKELIEEVNGNAISKKWFKGDESDQKISDIYSKSKNIEAGHGATAASAFEQSQNLSPSEREDYNRKYGRQINAPKDKGGGKVLHFSAPINVSVNGTDQKSIGEAEKRLYSAGSDTVANMSRAAAEAGRNM